MKFEKEEIFFKYAICSKCNHKDEFCKCKIGSPCLMLCQWDKAIKETSQQAQDIFIKMLDEFDSGSFFDVLDTEDDKFLDEDYSDDELIDRYRKELKSKLGVSNGN